jgi:ABC-type nickel/cobalt efflux system permease component RcnA
VNLDLIVCSLSESDYALNYVDRARFGLTKNISTNGNPNSPLFRIHSEGVHTPMRRHGQNWPKFFAPLSMMVVCAWPGTAHPMGNFSISHYAGLHIQADSIDLRYVIDMAEIPTFQEMQQSGLIARQDQPGLQAYLKAKACELAKGLLVTVNGRALTLEAVSQDAIFPPGAGNLSTMKLGFVYRAALSGSTTGGVYELAYRDTNYAGRAGWKEIVTSIGPAIHLADGAALRPDRSSMLSNYPTDLLTSPPQDLTATIIFTTVGGEGLHAVVPPTPVRSAPLHTSRVAATKSMTPPQTATAAPRTIELQPNRQATPRNAFTELIATKQTSLTVALIAALIAAGLGALHALEPGHGKTIVAAYLVGSKGTARHAFLLGAIVTISHTAGVYLLGGVTLYAQKYILPDRLYPFLGVMSGILIAGMGFYLLLQRFAGAEFAHSHSPAQDSGQPRKKITGRYLAVLGITGGMVPCPAALVVLLSAAALHRVGFGLFLIVAFSLGLAVVLIAMGLAAVYAGRIMSRVPLEGPLIQRWLPVASAAMITTLGCVIAVRALMAAGIVQIRI